MPQFYDEFNKHWLHICCVQGTEGQTRQKQACFFHDQLVIWPLLDAFCVSSFGSQKTPMRTFPPFTVEDSESQKVSSLFKIT